MISYWGSGFICLFICLSFFQYSRETGRDGQNLKIKKSDLEILQRERPQIFVCFYCVEDERFNIKKIWC